LLSRVTKGQQVFVGILCQCTPTMNKFEMNEWYRRRWGGSRNCGGMLFSNGMYHGMFDYYSGWRQLTTIIGRSMTEYDNEIPSGDGSDQEAAGSWDPECNVRLTSN